MNTLQYTHLSHPWEMSPNSWMKSLCFPSGSPSMVPSIIHLEGFDWTRRMTPWMLLSPAFNCTTPDSNGVSEEKDFNICHVS